MENQDHISSTNTAITRRKSKRHVSKQVPDSREAVEAPDQRNVRKRMRLNSREEGLISTKAAQDNTAYLLHHPKSCLRTIDLNRIINDKTWALLTAEEKSQCLRFLPSVDKAVLADGTAEINLGFFTHNVFLQDAFREFQHNLESGYLTASYVQKSLEASRERRKGIADAFKDQQFEKHWGDKQRLSSDSVAGSAGSIKLIDLLTNHYIREDDMFQYSRTFMSRSKSANKKTEIRKHCRLVKIDHDNETTLMFCIPPKEEEHSSRNLPDIKENVPLSLMALENVCLNIDGRINKDQRTNGNSWKVFRLRRGALDLGSLFELRERLYNELKDKKKQQGMFCV